MRLAIKKEIPNYGQSVEINNRYIYLVTSSYVDNAIINKNLLLREILRSNFEIFFFKAHLTFEYSLLLFKVC